MYRLHTEPLVTIAEGRIGYIYARDGLPLNPTQTLGAVVDCNGCHSIQEYATGGDPFLGQPKQIDATNYLRGGLGLPGDNGQLVISRDIRPELPSGRPASKTFAQFSAVFRHGTDFDNPGQILQVMPWPTFQSMTNDDIRAIYEYLSALPPATALGGG